MKKILTTLLLTITFISCQHEKVDLEFHLEKGKVYKQVYDSKTTVNQNLNGQEINMTITIKGKMSYKVLSVNPNDYDLEVKYNEVSMIIDSPQGKIEFSSEKNDKNDIFSAVLSKLTNGVFNVKMTKKGKILEVKNIDNLFDALFKNFEDIPKYKIKQVKAQLTKAYGAKAFKGNMEMVTAIFPDKPVSIGDKWTIKTNLESGMAASVTTEYSLTDLSAGYAVIKGNAVIKTEDKDAYIQTNGMPMKYDLKGTTTSEMKIDRNTGWLIKANTTQEIKGNAYIKGNSQLPEGMKIPMTMKTEGSYRGE